MSWQPISTAPNSGDFLVFIPGTRPFHVCSKIKVSNGTISIVGNHNSWDMDLPTHWHPLPDPPTSAATPAEER